MQFFRQRFCSAALALLFVPAIVQGQTQRTEPLVNVRDRIVIPEMTAEQKRLLAEQAQIFLRDLYVHRYHKPRYYSGLQDPGIEIQKVVKNVDKLSTKELELAIYRLFCAQRDLHLNYYFPAPHSIYTSFIPVTFARTVGKGNNFEVRISAVNEAQFQQYAPGQRVPALGDQVLTYNGKAVQLEVANLLPITQGANEYGGFTRALQNMTVLSHRRREVPAANEVKLQLKAYHPEGKGAIYSVTIPWLAQWVETGLTPTRVLKDSDALPMSKKFDLGVDDFQEEYNAFIRENGLEPPVIYPNNPTPEPQLKWGKFTNMHGTFGYLKLSSFTTGTGPENTVNEVRRLLLDELADTDGLIFDVRNNGGGAIRLADFLPQLFTRKNAEVLDFRLLNNDLNWRIFNETNFGLSNEDFRKAVNEAHGSGKIFTGTAQFNSDFNSNLLGQAYYKPVAVLANARSYSATDMFTCSMQDNKGAQFFGEDPKTGAGGANVIEHQFYVTQIGLPDVFKPLPTEHAMRVSWRQTIRFSPNEGKLIEDYGCSSDHNVQPVAEDLITGGIAQQLKITKILAEQSRWRKASARGEDNISERFLVRGIVDYGIFVKHTPSVYIYLDDKLQDRVMVHAGDTEVPVRFTLPASLESGKAARLTFVGMDEDRVLWNLKRRITLLDNKVVPGVGGFKIDFSTAPTVAPLAILNHGTTTSETGWKLVSPYLQIGHNPTYVNNLNTNAILFLDLRGRTSTYLDFGLLYDTERGWDFVEVQVSNNITKKVYLSVSGTKGMTRYSLNLSEFAGQDNVAVNFRFTSDSNTVAAGVRISDIAVR